MPAISNNRERGGPEILMLATELMVLLAKMKET